MLYYINNGQELIKVDEKTNKMINLHTKESNQVAYRPLYIIKEDGVLLYEDKVTDEGQKLKVKAGDVVMFLDMGVPVIIKDKAFAILAELYFNGLVNTPKESK